MTTHEKLKKNCLIPNEWPLNAKKWHDHGKTICSVPQVIMEDHVKVLEKKYSKITLLNITLTNIHEKTEKLI